MNEERLKIEKELRIVKDSYESDIISKEEYEKAKARIEAKLSELPDEDKPEVVEEQKIPEVVIAKENEPATEDNSIKIEKKEKEEEKKGSRLFMFILLLLVIAFALFVMLKPAEHSEDIKNISEDNQSTIITEEALPPDPTTVLTIITQEDCKTCYTKRTLSILKQLYPSLKVIRLENTELVPVGLDVLPAYIFDENITLTRSYKNTSGMFRQQGQYFIVNPEISGLQYYFNRTPKNNTLQMFVLLNHSSTEAADRNIKEFLDVFKDVDFRRTELVEHTRKKPHITTYPAYLVNNQYVFTGVLSADAIKEEFCKINYVKECELMLTPYLV